MKPEYIIIHHSASTWGDTFAIDHWHKTRGFGWVNTKTGVPYHVGYHYVILNGRVYGEDLYQAEFDGVIVPCRPEHVVGAHAKAQGMNHKSLGICVIGPPYTRKQNRALAGLVVDRQSQYGIPSVSVLGHKEVDSHKVDPTFSMEIFRRWISENQKKEEE